MVMNSICHQIVWVWGNYWWKSAQWSSRKGKACTPVAVELRGSCSCVASGYYLKSRFSDPLSSPVVGCSVGFCWHCYGLLTSILWSSFQSTLINDRIPEKWMISIIRLNTSTSSASLIFLSFKLLCKKNNPLNMCLSVNFVCMSTSSGNPEDFFFFLCQNPLTSITNQQTQYSFRKASLC